MPLLQRASAIVSWWQFFHTHFHTALVPAHTCEQVREFIKKEPENTILSSTKKESTPPAEERKNAACSHADDLSAMLQFLLLPFVWVGEHIICCVPQSLVCRRLLLLTSLLKTTLLRPVIIISKTTSPWIHLVGISLLPYEKFRESTVCNGSLV